MSLPAQLIEQIKQLSPDDQRKVAEYVAFLQWQTEPTPLSGTSWSFSFIEQFSQATPYASDVGEGMDIQMTIATVDGEARPALWAHPPVMGQAMIEYHVPIPERLSSLVLHTAIGIRDGSQISANNLVAFSLRVNGIRVWGHQINQRLWQSVAIPLDLSGGDVARIEFVTEALGSHEWTWAVWGTPELVGQVDDAA